MMPAFIIPQNPSQLVSLIQDLVTASFNRKYGSKEPDRVINAFAIATHDLTAEQIEVGLMTLMETKYCPDAAVFRGWCLGEKTISFTDAIADSYIGRHGALGNIIRWLESSGKSAISTAEKQAYDETYHLWQNIHSTADNTRAELAFKDAYEQIVATLVAARTPCQAYVPAVAIAQKVPEQTHEVADPEVAEFYLNQALALVG